MHRFGVKYYFFIYKVILCIWFLPVSIGNSQAMFNPVKLNVRNISLKQGLSQIVVTDLTFDEKGFLWVATFDGLNRFDGSSFKVFRYKPSTKGGLPSSYVYKLFADQNSHLYLRTAAGFHIFDTKLERIIEPNLLQKYKVIWVAYADVNHIWLYTQSAELLYVNAQTFDVERVISVVTNIAEICDLIEMKQIGDKLYLLDKCSNVLIYNINSNEFKFFKQTIKNLNQYTSYGIDKYNNIFFTSAWNDFAYFNTTTEKYEIPSYTKLNSKFFGINDVVYDSISNVLYLSSYGQGLFVYDYNLDSLFQFKKGNPALGLSGNYLLKLKLLPSGMLFIGYDGVGFDIVDPLVKQFVPIVLNDLDENKNIKFVRKLLEDAQGRILIGTAGSGLVRYDRRKNSFDFFSDLYQNAGKDKFIIEMIFSGNELWLGYNGSGIGIVDSSTMKLKSIIQVGEADNELTSGTIWSMLDDNRGSIWIGTREKGINIIDKITKKIIKISPKEFPFFEANGVRTLRLKRDGKILAGTEKGMFEINRDNLVTVQVFPSLDTSLDVAMRSIKTIFEDSKGNLWLGTNGGGLMVLDENYNPIKHLSSSNILVNDVIYGILPERSNSLWISTNMGISNLIWSDTILTPSTTIKVINFEEQNGLQSNEFNTGAYVLLSSNEMVFGGLNGINIFNPKEVVVKSKNSKVYINEFKVFENTYKSDTSVSFLNKINLKAFENSISIGFNAIEYSLPEKTQFQYRLIGYDDTWVDSKNRNYVSYTNLNSGDYEFQVRASSPNDGWDLDYTSLRIHISTPFYRTWWFISLVGLGLAQLGYLFYRYRMKQIKDKEELRIQYTKELAEVEMKALRAQINPHFLFNSLNSINNFILRNDTDKASKYLVKFSQLVRGILTNSSSTYISLEEELKTIELYMLIEGMRFSNQFNFEIVIDKDIVVSVHRIPSLLLQPYVENAIWHGLLHKEGEKIIKIEVSNFDENLILITITDNGIGRKLALEMKQNTKSHKSFGLQIGEKRMKLLNSDGMDRAKVEVVDLHFNEISTGTQVRIYLPTDIIFNN